MWMINYKHSNNFKNYYFRQYKVSETGATIRKKALKLTDILKRHNKKTNFDEAK